MILMLDTTAISFSGAVNYAVWLSRINSGKKNDAFPRCSKLSCDCCFIPNRTASRHGHGRYKKLSDGIDGAEKPRGAVVALSESVSELDLKLDEN